MKLLLIFDHRFMRSTDGVIYSTKSYGRSFFTRRYLETFESVTIVARVAEAAAARPADAEPTEGPGVTVASLGDWQGVGGLLRARGAVRRALDRHLDAAEAVVLVAPGMLATLARRALVRRARPYGVEVVGDPWDAMAPGSMRHPLRPLLRRAATRALGRLCREAAAAAYVTRAALQRRYPCPGFAIGVSDVVLPADAFAAAPRRPAAGGPRTLVTVGSMAQLYKAQDVLIDAVALAVDAGLDLRLVLVGDGRHRAELSARAAARGIAGRVDFPGALPAGAPIRRALDAADCFVLPSHQEGLPRAMVEAMARGLPCVGSTVGGIPELLPPEDLVPPGDARALAAKLREVLADDDRMARASARNLEVARAYRDLDADRRAFLEHLRAATRRRETTRPGDRRPTEAGSRNTRDDAGPAPSLRRNAAWAAAGTVGYAACQCAVLIVLAKLSSAADVGRFALALAVTAPVMLAASLQLRVVQATDARGDHAFGTYLGLRLATTGLALALIALVAIAADYPRPMLALIGLVAAAKACEAVSDVVFGRLQQHEDLRRIAGSMLAKGVLSVTSMAAGLVLTGDLRVAAALMAFAWGAWLVGYDLPAARRLGSVRPRFERRALARLAWLALPMGAVAGLQSLVTNVPRYAIEAHAGPAALGYFAAIAYLVLAGNQPMMALWAAASPRLARLHERDRRAYRRLSHRTMLVAAGMGLATIVVAAALGRPLLAILYAPDYAVHADVLVWLAVAAAVGYQASALASSITAARRFPEQLWVAALTLAVAWVASIVLVPRFGLVGAAGALVAAAGAQAACLGAVYLRCCRPDPAERGTTALEGRPALPGRPASLVTP